MHEIRLGRIRASIWANRSEQGHIWFNISFTRLYKEGERWKGAAGFGKDDLPLVSKVAEMAYAWIWDHEGAELDPRSVS